MKKEIVLNQDTQINAIVVVDKKNNEVFQSMNLNMSLGEWLMKSVMMSLLEQKPVIPNIYGKTLTYEVDGGGKTSKGYTYKASAYKQENDDTLIIVNVLEGIVD